MHFQTIKELAALLEEKNSLTDEERHQLANDERKGVQNLLTRWEHKQTKIKGLEEQYERMWLFEAQLQAKGYVLIAGIDEAGRGPLAGPVVASAVILDKSKPIIGVNDSKQLTRNQRRELLEKIRDTAVSIGVGIATAKEIDDYNIYQATKLAMQRAVLELDPKPDYLLVDAMTVPVDVQQHAITKGDARSVSIASASIVAKETRDAMMEDLDRLYPGYGFSDHHGYGTKAHLEAIERLGPCPEHRMSFAPLKKGKDE